MAKVANVLIGKASGSVGGSTFSSWKGINVLKSKPTVVANPNTDAQKCQRSAMAFLVAVFRIMTGIINLGFKELAVKKSAFNAFQSYNVKNAMDRSTPPTPVFEPENFLISKGTITDTPMLTCVADDSDATVAVTYLSTALLPGQSATDRALIAVYNEDKSDWTSKVETEIRSTGAASIALPAAWEVGDTLHVYVGFVDAAGAKASDSVYQTTDIVA